ncbi:MAG: hypothetical protein ACRDVE_02090 [Actinocrinis sp.]
MAADDLPEPLVKLLGILGVDWPDISEEAVLQFASHLRTFGSSVDSTVQDATSAIAGIAQGYQGDSTARMQSGWEYLASNHISEIKECCTVVADALDAAAGVIVAKKVAAIAELVGMAIAFFADEAAAAVTFGLSELALPAIEAGVRLMTRELERELEQYLINEVINGLAKPALDKVMQAIENLLWSSAPQGGSGGSGRVQIEPSTVTTNTAALRTHAQTVLEHVDTLKQGIAELNF